MICAEFVLSNGVQFVAAAASQPADLSQCQAVVLTGQETGAMTLTAFPTEADAMTAFVWGFSLVLISYVTAWGCGAVINLIGRK